MKVQRVFVEATLVIYIDDNDRLKAQTKVKKEMNKIANILLKEADTIVGDYRIDEIRELNVGN